MSKAPPCPRGHVATEVVGDGLYRCLICDGLFDDSPDEGGTVRSRDPSRAAESKEEFEIRQRQRDARRRR